MKHVALAWLIAFLATSCALVQHGAAPTHVNLQGDVNALRTAFNGALGDVRAIFLASPT